MELGKEQGVRVIKLNYASNVKVNQVSFNPFEKNLPVLCVVGNNIFRIYRFTEGTLKPLTFQKTDHRNNIAHAWLTPERIAVTTEDGKILIYENAELRMEIPTNLPSEVNFRPHHLTAIRAGPNGFVAGSNNGMLQEWDRAEDTSLYRCAKEVKVESAAIRGITLSSNEDMATCAMENNQLISVSSLQSDDVKVEKLSQAHHAGITGLDVCIRKPLAATCGSDQSVRVWNYTENTMEIAKFFKSEPHCVAFHPSGLFLLVGFAEGVKLLKILLDDIRPFWEYGARGCRECRFSHGGQFFAMAHENIVTVRSTWSFELIITLKGHTGKVRSIAWSPDDSRLLTVAHDGVTIEWDLRLQKRVAEH
ncbi:WD40-repeat-containing domain protein, partial [Catenaria anguillulae PL171]